MFSHFCIENLFYGNAMDFEAVLSTQIYPKMFSTDFIFRQPKKSGWIQATMQQNTIADW